MIKSLLLLIKMYVFAYSFLCVGMHVLCVACTLRSEHNLQEPVLSHHVDPRASAQVVRFGSKHLYLLCLFSGLSVPDLKVEIVVFGRPQHLT